MEYAKMLNFIHFTIISGDSCNKKRKCMCVYILYIYNVM